MRSRRGRGPRAARGLELRGRRKDGSEFPAEINLTPFEAAGGFRVVATVTDLSARRDDEDRMQTLTRAYRSLAEMNEAIVRATDDLELFAETCRVAVEQAGYLGALDRHGRPRTVGVVRVASAGGLDDYVDQLGLISGDRERGWRRDVEDAGAGHRAVHRRRRRRPSSSAASRPPPHCRSVGAATSSAR